MNNLDALERKSPFFALELRTMEKHEVPFVSLPLPKEETVALYLYALGDDAWQGKILKWLEEKKERKIYLIPENPQILHALSIPLINHPRLKIGREFATYAWEHLFKPWELFGKDRRELSEWILGTELTFSLYQDFGTTLLTNVFENLSIKEEVKKGDALSGEFRGTAAIICGAGPSLEESLKDIKKLGERALIIGGGSALSPLSKAHIPIHFAAALDPDPPTERFYRQNHFETPLFYQNQVSHTLLSCHHGTKLCMGESRSFELEEWLTEELSLTSCDVGWNVSTFAVMVATLLGCDPIYFVGMDLCVYDEASYAEGVEGMDARSNPIQMKDRKGNVVFTRPDFLMSKMWLERFAEKNPKTTFINASARGLKIEGIPDGPLLIPMVNKDLQAKVHQKVMRAPGLDCSLIFKKLMGLDESLKKTLSILREMLSALHQNLSTPLQDFELEEEIFYSLHLLPLWKMWKNLLQTDEVIEKMENPSFEKKLQQILFYKDVTEKFCHARKLPV